MDRLNLINTALSGISELQLSSDATENSIGDKARAGYTEALYDLLSRHRWSFLMSDAYLNQPETTDSIDFRYKFIIPDQLERLFSVQRDPFNYQDLLLLTINRDPINLKEYQYRGDNYIYSNYDSIYIAFLRKDIENVATLPSGFKKSLILLMKMQYALSFKSSVLVANSFEQQSERAIRIAITNDISQARTLGLSNKDPNVFRNTSYDYEVY